MEKILETSIDNESQVLEIGRALSSPLRISMLRLLAQEGMNVKELAFRLNLPISTASANVKQLEDAGLIITNLQSGKRGSMKLCYIKNEQVRVQFTQNANARQDGSYIVDMPIGGYSDCSVVQTCGLVNEYQYIGKDDDPRTFYSTRRFSAQLLWFKRGYVEYKFPLELAGHITGISFSLELCSEAPGFRKTYPSDITVWVNGVDIGTWTCPGDFGGRRGNCTPAWWPLDSTQYGILKRWQVNADGSFIDEARISSVRVGDLLLGERDHVSFRIGIKEGAHNEGGINIFGEKFGDYAQNIVMRAEYVRKR